MSTSELKFVMAKLDVHFTDQELQEMVLEADIDGDGQVSSFSNLNTVSVSGDLRRVLSHDDR